MNEPDDEILSVWEPALEDVLIDEYLDSPAGDLVCDSFRSSFVHVVKYGKNLPPSDSNRGSMEMCVVHARKAMATKNMAALDGWLFALGVIGTLIEQIPKYQKKLYQADLARRIQPQGTQANKDKSAASKADLHKAINEYLTNAPEALAKGNKACLRFLVKWKLTYGYAEATIFNSHIKKLFAAKRKSLKAEK